MRCTRCNTINIVPTEPEKGCSTEVYRNPQAKEKEKKVIADGNDHQEKK
jgi:hypothetical protein